MKSNQLEASKSNIAAGDVSTYDSQPGAANYRRAMNILTVALLIGALGAAVRTQDVLVQHPYDSFSTSVQAFIEQAAADPHGELFLYEDRVHTKHSGCHTARSACMCSSPTTFLHAWHRGR